MPDDDMKIADIRQAAKEANGMAIKLSTSNFPDVVRELYPKLDALSRKLQGTPQFHDALAYAAQAKAKCLRLENSNRYGLNPAEINQLVKEVKEMASAAEADVKQKKKVTGWFGNLFGFGYQKA